MFENAKPQRVTIPINTAADLAEEHDRLEEQLEDLLQDQPPPKPQRLGGHNTTPPDIEAKIKEIETLEQRMEDSWVDFVLEPRPGDEWVDFRSEHPPTKPGQPYNLSALIQHFIPECIVEPQLAPRSKPEVADGDWDRALAGGIWWGDIEKMASAVIGFYIRSFDVPKSRLVLAVRATFDEQQEQLARSASPNAGTKAGSRRLGQSTTTPKGS